MGEWLPDWEDHNEEPQWNEGGVHRQPNWRGEVHQEESPLLQQLGAIDQDLRTKRKYPDKEVAEVRDEYCREINNARVKFEKVASEGLGRSDIDAIYHFRLCEIYLNMVDDPRLQHDLKPNYMVAYEMYRGGIERLRKALGNTKRKVYKMAPAQFEKMRNRLANSTKYNELFHACLKENRLIQFADTEGLESWQGNA